LISGLARAVRTGEQKQKDRRGGLFVWVLLSVLPGGGHLSQPRFKQFD